MPNIRRLHGQLAVTILAVALAACSGAPTTAGQEGALSVGKDGKVSLKVAGQVIKLATPDGKALRDLAIMVGGKVYRTKDGALNLPKEALEEIRRGGQAIVMAPGYLPQKLRVGGPGEITLVPVAKAGDGAVSSLGGSFQVPSAALALDFQSGLVKAGGSTKVVVGTYRPLSNELALGERDRLNKIVGNAAAGCEQPLPCPPAKVGLGVQIAVDGPLAEGTIALTYDMTAMARAGGSQAEAADRIRKTLAQIDATGNARWRQALRENYRLSERDGKLTFTITLGSAFGQTDSVARIHVEGVALLGVDLEVTVVAATQAKLPEAGFPGATGIGGNEPTGVGTGGQLPPLAGLPATGGGGIISDVGTTLVSNNGGGLIANNGGSLIGKVKAPAGLLSDGGAALHGKYRVSMAGDVEAPGSLVRVHDAGGATLGGPVTADPAADYRIAGLVPSRKVVFVEAQLGGGTARTIAPAPGEREVRADIDTASTAIAAWVLDAIAKGEGDEDGVNMQRFAADVAAIATRLTAAEATLVCTGDLATVAALVESKITPTALAGGTGTASSVTRFVGTGTAGKADAPDGLQAQLNYPIGLAADAAGNLYVAEEVNRLVRKIAPSGATTMLAGGNDAGPPAWADGNGATSLWGGPRGIAVDPAGTTLWVCDRANQMIRKIQLATGQTNTVAGALPPGGYVNGSLAEARFDDPEGIAVAPNGDVYVTDRDNHAVRVLRADGSGVKTFAGADPAVAPAARAGFANGPNIFARFNWPQGLAVDRNGFLYVADTRNDCIRRITPGGEVSTFAGQPGSSGFQDGPAASARFVAPYGVAVDADGNVYVSEQTSPEHNRIRRISAAGVVSTLAGEGPPGLMDMPEFSVARFNTPHGLAVVGTRVYVADSQNHCIRVIE